MSHLVRIIRITTPFVIYSLFLHTNVSSSTSTNLLFIIHERVLIHHISFIVWPILINDGLFYFMSIVALGFFQRMADVLNFHLKSQKKKQNS